MSSTNDYELVIFTGESRHRFVEDTLLCVGGPTGYVIRFDYKTKYLESPLSTNFDHYVGKTTLLVTYSSKLDEKQWLPVRAAKILAYNLEQDQIDLTIELQDHISLKENYRTQFYSCVSIGSDTHIVNCKIPCYYFSTLSFHNGFKENVKCLLDKFRNSYI